MPLCFYAMICDGRMAFFLVFIAVFELERSGRENEATSAVDVT
jgi:hypothetical protein